jgi:hypothetical protein
MNAMTDPAADALIAHLQTQQHLHPHRTLHRILHDIPDHLGLTLKHAQQATSAISFDPHEKVGRLRRCQLLQLARAVHRLSRQNRPLISHLFQPA